MDIEPDTTELRNFYLSYQCHGVVALIEYLSSPPAQGISSIGSSTIGLAEILKEIWVDERAQMEAAWFRTRSLHIGSRDGSVTPLQWLAKLAEVFEKLPIPSRNKFDEICNEFAVISQLTPAGHVEMWRESGIYSIPADEYERTRQYTDEELAPYRIERSRVFSIDGDTETVPFDAMFEETKH